MSEAIVEIVGMTAIMVLPKEMERRRRQFWRSLATGMAKEMGKMGQR
jgi:hypothetical protein